ncbi:Cysteine synthase 2 [Saitoella coloradoensis]
MSASSATPYDRSTLLTGLTIGVLLTLSASKLLRLLNFQPSENTGIESHGKIAPEKDIRVGVEGLIGNTPLVKIKSLSEATGCEILAKAEFLNPGNSPKDRVALSMILEAEKNGLLRPSHSLHHRPTDNTDDHNAVSSHLRADNDSLEHTTSGKVEDPDTIYEGTVGSTGISLAILARARGYRAHICMPDDQSPEKSNLLRALGAHVEQVRPASIVDKSQFVNRANSRAEEHSADQGRDSRGFFADQFENEANWRAHYDTTGPEVFSQSGGIVDAFVAGAGTGGTLSGCVKYLKPLLPDMKVFLADPPGSGLFNKVNYGVMFDEKEREGRRRRHQVDTVVEGIGINRITNNFRRGEEYVDKAIRVTDKEAVAMSRYLVEHDGLFLGSSSAVNCVAAVRAARELGEGSGKVVVTILCDPGNRHLGKFWSDEYLKDYGIDMDDLDWSDLRFLDQK